MSARRLGKGISMNIFSKLLRDESGASAAEYALILAIIGTAIGLAAIGLGNAIETSITTATDQITAVQTAP